MFFCKKLWLWPCRWLYRKKNLQFDWQPNMIKPLNWGSYRHRQCCYHCNAISYVQDGQPEEDLLYTNWGRGAEYRRQQLSASSCHVCMASRCSQRCAVLYASIHLASFFQNLFCFSLWKWSRLTSLEDFLEVNGASPLTQIKGFSHWRCSVLIVLL